MSGADDKTAAGRAACVVLLGTWYRVHIPHAAATLRAGVLEPLDAADVLMLLTYRDDDRFVASSAEAGVRSHLAPVLETLGSALAQIQIERQLTTQELTALVESSTHWHPFFNKYRDSVPRTCFEKGTNRSSLSNHTSPYLCPGMKEMGNSFMAPVNTSVATRPRDEHQQLATTASRPPHQPRVSPMLAVFRSSARRTSTSSASCTCTTGSTRCCAPTRLAARVTVVGTSMWYGRGLSSNGCGHTRRSRPSEKRRHGRRLGATFGYRLRRISALT